MEKKKIQIIVTTSQEILDHWEELAQRRYGDKSQESMDKIAQDACHWLMERWEKGDVSLYERFWCLMALHWPFKHLRAVAWSKLVFEKYLDW
jgi:hypothetical protein